LGSGILKAAVRVVLARPKTATTDRASLNTVHLSTVGINWKSSPVGQISGLRDRKEGLLTTSDTQSQRGSLLVSFRRLC